MLSETVLVVQEGLDQVVVFAAADPTQRSVIAVGGKPHEIEVTPDACTAYVSNFGLLEANLKIGTPGTTISVLDVNGRVERERFRLPLDAAAPHGLKLRPPEYRELFTNAEAGSGAMIVFDADSGAVRRTFPLPPGVHNFLFDAEGTSLFAFTLDGAVCRIDADSGTVIASVQAGSPRGLAWSAGFRHLIVSGRNQLLLLDPARLTVERRFPDLGVGQVFYPLATPDGRRILAPAVLDGVLLILDADTGAVADRIETGSPLLAVMGPGGKHAWISNVKVPAGMLGPETRGTEGGIDLLDLATMHTTRIPGIPDANGLAVASLA